MNKETVKVNGIKLPITEKCKGLMGKSLENMTREELIASVHFTYSQLISCQSRMEDEVKILSSWNFNQKNFNQNANINLNDEVE